MDDVRLVGLGTAPPARGKWFRIVESHGVQRWSHLLIDVAADDAPLAMQARLEAEVGPPADVHVDCMLVQLGTATAATEEAFNRTMRHGDMARAMRLDGARSARRYALSPVRGRCDWESITFFGFEGADRSALTSALVDAAEVWDGDPSCIVMRIEGVEEGRLPS